MSGKAAARVNVGLLMAAFLTGSDKYFGTGHFFLSGHARPLVDGPRDVGLSIRFLSLHVALGSDVRDDVWPVSPPVTNTNVTWQSIQNTDPLYG